MSRAQLEALGDAALTSALTQALRGRRRNSTLAMPAAGRSCSAPPPPRPAEMADVVVQRMSSASFFDEEAAAAAEAELSALGEAAVWRSEVQALEAYVDGWARYARSLEERLRRLREMRVDEALEAAKALEVREELVTHDGGDRNVTAFTTFSSKTKLYFTKF